MAGRKRATVSRKELRAVGVSEVLAMRQRLSNGAGSDGDKQLLERVLAYYRARFTSGNLSEKTARQLGIA